MTVGHGICECLAPSCCLCCCLCFFFRQAWHGLDHSPHLLRADEIEDCCYRLSSVLCAAWVPVQGCGSCGLQQYTPQQQQQQQQQQLLAVLQPASPPALPVPLPAAVAAAARRGCPRSSWQT
jgi:hypothetical protein